MAGIARLDEDHQLTTGVLQSHIRLLEDVRAHARPLLISMKSMLHNVPPLTGLRERHGGVSDHCKLGSG